MKKAMDERLQLAEERKKQIKADRKHQKMKKEINHFVGHSAFRQKMFERNNILYDLYMQEKEKNLIVCQIDYLIQGIRIAI